MELFRRISRITNIDIRNIASLLNWPNGASCTKSKNITIVSIVEFVLTVLNTAEEANHWTDL